MLQGEHFAILLIVIKVPFVVKTFVLSIFLCLFYTGFTILFVFILSSTYYSSCIHSNDILLIIWIHRVGKKITVLADLDLHCFQKST